MDTRDVVLALSLDEEALRQLEKERIRLLTRIAIHRQHLSPLSRLPPELLVVIFLFCLPEGRIRPRVEDAPLLICRVSSAWRNLAISTPPLWAELALPSTPINRASACALFNLYTSRSAPGPLSIDLINDASNIGLDDGFAGSIFAEITSDAQRLKRVVIDAYTTVNQLRFFSLLQKPLTALHHLSLVVCEPDMRNVQEDTEVQSIQWLSVFADAPALRTLRLTYHDSQIPLADIPLPWQQLRDLDINVHPRSLDDILTLLDDWPSLIQSRIVLSGASAPPIRSRLVRIPNLKKLVISSECTVGAFFESIRCPSLEDLSLKWNPMHDAAFHEYSPAHAITSLCAGPRLQRLELDNIPLFIEDLTDLLQQLPSLVDLRLAARTCAYARGSEMLLDALTWSTTISYQQLIPNLKHLDLTLFHNVGDALMNMLESRYAQDLSYPSRADENTAVTLKTVYLRFVGSTTGMHAFDWGRLYELAEGGLEVTVQDDYSHAVRYSISQ